MRIRFRVAHLAFLVGLVASSMFVYTMRQRRAEYARHAEGHEILASSYLRDVRAIRRTVDDNVWARGDRLLQVAIDGLEKAHAKERAAADMWWRAARSPWNGPPVEKPHPFVARQMFRD
jgi:hypothetical protein